VVVVVVVLVVVVAVLVVSVVVVVVVAVLLVLVVVEVVVVVSVVDVVLVVVPVFVVVVVVSVVDVVLVVVPVFVVVEDVLDVVVEVVVVVEGLVTVLGLTNATTNVAMIAASKQATIGVTDIYKRKRRQRILLRQTYGIGLYVMDKYYSIPFSFIGLGFRLIYVIFFRRYRSSFLILFNMDIFWKE
jgi:hypothetical protein